MKKEKTLELRKALNKYNINSRIFGPWKNNTGSLYYCLIIKNIGGTKWNGIWKDQKTSSELVM